MDFEGHSPPNQGDQWLNVKGYIAKLCEAGWTRKDIFHLVSHIDTNEGSMPEECIEAVGEYLDVLLGQVSPFNIVRFPGEPDGHDELAGYVLRKEWLK